ncbi:MAG TPA: hypothetical protein VFJ14_11525 [Nocardioidaceae bacterium]|nr:hypothetical protein [Nocardioidaceae bacterium]
MMQMLLAIDPEEVTAGWLGLFIVLAIVVAVVVLFRSMRRQLRKVDFPEADVGSESGSESDARRTPDRTSAPATDDADTDR